MNKVLKNSVTIMAVLMAATFGMVGSATAAQPLTTADCGAVLGGPGYTPGDNTFTLTQDMNCWGANWTKHGLIIGAPGIIIDGQGYALIGSDPTVNNGYPLPETVPPSGGGRRQCEVDTYVEYAHPTDPGVWCVGHPCRQGVDGLPLDSGVLNAKATANQTTTPYPAAPAGQGGNNNVTVKNLKITGFCDGIWLSGDCAGTERRLTGLVIEGNQIYNNGVAIPVNDFRLEQTGADDGGDWVGTKAQSNCAGQPQGAICPASGSRYYNDGIFTAQIGLDTANSGTYQYKECVLGGEEHPGLYCPDGIMPPVIGQDCQTACAALPADRNFIGHNKVYNQRGYTCTSCSGGNGINLQGGNELEVGNLWAFAAEVKGNILKNNSGSGISFTHAGIYSRIHGNVAQGNQLGGITNPCAWNAHNYLFYNTVEGNYCVGIGALAPQKVKKNVVTNTQACANPEYTELGFDILGQGILAVECCDTGYTPALCQDGEGTELVQNTSVANAEDFDIDDRSGGCTFGDSNLCNDSGGGDYMDATPSFGTYDCRYVSGPMLNCKSDINHDCSVNIKDFNFLPPEWTATTGVDCRGLW
jgi:hypothetical protein